MPLPRPFRLLPSRYVQWSCTTPTILFTLSKITDFTPERTGKAMFVDWVMIYTGYLAAVYPPGFTSCEEEETGLEEHSIRGLPV